MFENKYVWNADEFGLFCRQPSVCSLSSTAVLGFKKEKSRLSFLACFNKDGLEKLPLLIIGNSKRPRCFKKNLGETLGWTIILARMNIWMRSCFFDWLMWVDKYAGATNGWKIFCWLTTVRVKRRATLYHHCRMWRSNTFHSILPGKCSPWFGVLSHGSRLDIRAAFNCGCLAI